MEAHKASEILGVLIQRPNYLPVEVMLHFMLILE
jgi:hypothetical protein